MGGGGGGGVGGEEGWGGGEEGGVYYADVQHTLFLLPFYSDMKRQHWRCSQHDLMNLPQKDNTETVRNRI